jgi:hypothetical protein
VILNTDMKNLLKSVIVYLGDHAHRRFVATIIALGATHLLGKALDADAVANMLEIIIGGFGGAWSSTNPAVEAA